MTKLIILKPLLLALLLACTQAAYSDDLIPGPGLFSGKTGEHIILKTKKLSNKEASEQATETSGDAKTPSQANQELLPAAQPLATSSSAPADVNEFGLYKEWRSAKTANSSEYRDFQQWIEYKQFLKQQGGR